MFPKVAHAVEAQDARKALYSHPFIDVRGAWQDDHHHDRFSNDNGADEMTKRERLFAVLWIVWAVLWAAVWWVDAEYWKHPSNIGAWLTRVVVIPSAAYAAWLGVRRIRRWLDTGD